MAASLQCDTGGRVSTLKWKSLSGLMITGNLSSVYQTCLFLSRILALTNCLQDFQAAFIPELLEIITEYLICLHS